ncbi:MAG: hypothetical protein Kow00109_13120 [Acidobacteriota bacterium]
MRGWRRLRQVLWEGFRRFAHRLGRFNSLVLLTLVYFLVVTPLGLVRRLATRSSRSQPHWRPRETPSPRHFEKQY